MNVVQEILTRVSLAAAGGLIFACFVLRYGAAVLRLAERALRGFAALPFAAKVVLPAFLGVAILYGGSKTNAPPAQLLRSLPRMVPVRWRFADDTVTNRTRFDNWHRRGAVNDWRRVKFADGWVFPSGTNRLASAMVMSRGEIRPRLQNTNAVARLSERLTMRPGEAEFFAERTASNTYLFAWENCRDATNALKSAAVELFRNGDIRVTEQDGVRFLPRQIPFPHDGFGQDADWVRANFTNAEEILSVGYPNWVDAQVGVGLENGLYKLTATFPADPLEATLLTVGDYRVCVTNAGEYVFLLEKGVSYEYRTEPFAEDLRISAVDDIPSRPRLLAGGATWWVWQWWPDDLGFQHDIETAVRRGEVIWRPRFQGRFVSATPTGLSRTIEVAADFIDCRVTNRVNYVWWSPNYNVEIRTPNARQTFVDLFNVAESNLQLYVHATVRTNEYTSMLISRTGAPGVRVPTLELDVPRVFPVRTAVAGAVRFTSPAPTNGTVRIVRGYLLGTTVMCEGYGWNDDGATTEIPFSGETDLVIPLRLFAEASADRYRGEPLRAEVTLEGSDETLVAESILTPIDRIVEPITTVRHATNGVSRIVNPCCCIAGSNAWMHVEVFPTDFPDGQIVWHVKSGSASFIGGNTGCDVCVAVTGEEDAEIEVDFGGCIGERPTFKLRPEALQTVRVYPVEICDEREQPSITRAHVEDLLREVNVIYEQVGLHFVVATNVEVVVNNRWSQDGLLDDRVMREIQNHLSGTGGVEMYFVSGKYGERKPYGRGSQDGILVRKTANSTTLAHEIGHACGLTDIYDHCDGIYFSGTDYRVDEVKLPYDWGSYNWLLAHDDLVKRLLMYGYHLDEKADIPAGGVFGLKKIGRRVHKDLTNVGRDGMLLFPPRSN